MVAAAVTFAVIATAAALWHLRGQNDPAATTAPASTGTTLTQMASIPLPGDTSRHDYAHLGAGQVRPRDWTATTPQCQHVRMHADSQARRQQPADEQVELAVETLRMLADVTRVRVLWALLDGELPVNDLADAVGKPRSGVSQHLAKLRLARLVATRKQGNQVFYRLDNPHLRQLVEDAIYHAEHAGTDVPEHHRTDADITALTAPASRARRGIR